MDEDCATSKQDMQYLPMYLGPHWGKLRVEIFSWLRISRVQWLLGVRFVGS